MKSIDLYCFTLRNFEKTGGGSIRISGMLNALAEYGVNIHLYTLADSVSYLHDSVQYYKLPKELENINKKKFQAALSFLSLSPTNNMFSKELALLKDFFATHEREKPILFFEYLDISLGYFLKKNGVISDYMCDVHGIVPLEFRENLKTEPKSKALFNYMKVISAEKLDNKVYNNAYAVLFPSDGVQDYFANQTIKNTAVKKVVINESINELLLHQKVDSSVKEELIEKKVIDKEDTVVMFIGDFKPFGGVGDLFDAFKLYIEKYDSSNVKLILIGDGLLHAKLTKRVEEENLQGKIKMLGRIPYSTLRSYQHSADILVCPDRDTEYSQRLPHIKYFDSICSGRIVINGNFRFTETLNPNEKFSLNFEPSNIESLAEVIDYAVKNKEELHARYSKNSEEAKKEYVYKKAVYPFYKFLVNED